MKEFRFEPFTIPTAWQGKYTGIFTVSQILISRRMQLSLTQEQVAERAHIKQPQYQRLESGERSLRDCTMDIGLSICAALLLDPYQLLPINVNQPAVEGSLPMPTYVEPIANRAEHRIGRKRLPRRDVIPVYADYKNCTLFISGNIAVPNEAPCYLRMSWQAFGRNIILIPYHQPVEDSFRIPDECDTHTLLRMDISSIPDDLLDTFKAMGGLVQLDAYLLKSENGNVSLSISMLLARRVDERILEAYTIKDMPLAADVKSASAVIGG